MLKSDMKSCPSVTDPLFSRLDASLLAAKVLTTKPLNIQLI